MTRNILLGTTLLLIALSIFAMPELPTFTPNQPYQEVKTELMKQGWKPVKNAKITGSSLYAQELYQQGLEEVVDCVSMELDGCWFRYKKGKQTLEVKTITKKLEFNSIEKLK